MFKLVFIDKTSYFDDLVQLQSILNAYKHVLNSSWIDIYESENISVIKIRPRLLGGKGGFGSNLRAQGNKLSSKNRSGNYDSCRDLNGKKIRAVSQAKQIDDYLKGKPSLDQLKTTVIRRKMANDVKLSIKGKNLDKNLEKDCAEIALEIETHIMGKSCK